MKAEKIKLSLYENKRVVIENYKHLLDLEDDHILVDIYTITGSELKINIMDKFVIEIIGNVTGILIGD